MSIQIPERFRKGVESLPPKLRSLVEAELEAGNRIRKVEAGDPAPADGTCVMLAKPVSTRARGTGDGLAFWLESTSEYKASFTDQNARHFVLEAPLEEDGAYPDMNEIREAANRPGAVSFVQRSELPASAQSGAVPLSTVEKFRAGMALDYDKWHDGKGYALDMFTHATDAEKAEIFKLLVPPRGWRDVEALVALDTEAARTALQNALKSGNDEVRAAVLRHAPSAATEAERLETLLLGLKQSEFYGGLTSVLDQVEELHPPEIINALFRGLFEREGEVATHFSAMLLFLHGKADSNFDWDRRPLFLKFNTEDRTERTDAFNELCALLELDPAAVMTGIRD